ncbi:MAG: Na+/H+ antiporter subunit D [Verrucomicrobiales bacterium]|nr:Na+/H+ antiporter subunit D [Verrucomicrobiales bacterium]
MTAELLLSMPVVLPLASGLVLLMGRDCPVWQRFGLVVATALHAVAALALTQRVIGDGEVLEMALGGWKAPVGIAFRADILSAMMVLVSSMVALAGAVYATAEIGRTVWRRRYAFFYLLLLAGISGAFLTGDLFNLFVWFETMLMASFALMALGRRRRTRSETIVYIAVNALSSFFFLAGLGLFYGALGSLNLTHIADQLAMTGEPADWTELYGGAVLLLLAFGTKAGAFPLFFWLPDSYPQTGIATSAVFGGLLTKVGVYSLYRVFGGTLGFLSADWGPLFLGVGAATMIVGVLGAASRAHLREILSWHIISQIGYLILGLGIFTAGSIGAGIFYTVHHIVVKANLFFASGLIARAGGSEKLAAIGGLLRTHPILAFLFAIPALSLAGIPPLSGFFAKWLLVREAFRAEEWIWAGSALAVGALTLFSMAKIWSEAFWKDSPRRFFKSRALPLVQVATVFTLGLATVTIGLASEYLFHLSTLAAGQVVGRDPTVNLPTTP